MDDWPAHVYVDKQQTISARGDGGLLKKYFRRKILWLEIMA